MASDTVAIALGVVIPVIVIGIVVIVIVYMIKKKRFKMFHRRKNFKEVSFKDNPALTGKFPDTPRNSAMDDVETGKENGGYVTTTISSDESETSFTLNDMVLDKREHKNFSNCENEISRTLNNCQLDSDKQCENRKQSVSANKIESEIVNTNKKQNEQKEDKTCDVIGTETSQETYYENKKSSETSNNDFLEHDVRSERNLDNVEQSDEERQSIKQIEDIPL